MKRQLAKVQQIKAKIQTLIKLVGLGIKKYIVQLLDLEAKLEEGQKEQMITVGSKILKKSYGNKQPIITGTVIQITGDTASIKWDNGKNFSRPHNYKKEQKLKDLQLFSEEIVNKIKAKRNSKAFVEFKALVLQCGQNWCDANINHPYWAVEKGYIERKYNKEKVTSDGRVVGYDGMKEFRITDKGVEFAASL